MRLPLHTISTAIRFFLPVLGPFLFASFIPPPDYLSFVVVYFGWMVTVAFLSSKLGTKKETRLRIPDVLAGVLLIVTALISLHLFRAKIADHTYSLLIAALFLIPASMLAASGSRNQLAIILSVIRSIAWAFLSFTLLTGSFRWQSFVVAISLAAISEVRLPMLLVLNCPPFSRSGDSTQLRPSKWLSVVQVSLLLLAILPIGYLAVLGALPRLYLTSLVALWLARPVFVACQGNRSKDPAQIDKHLQIFQALFLLLLAVVSVASWWRI